MINAYESLILIGLFFCGAMFVALLIEPGDDE
mgnify:CR=1 FL=1